MSRRLVTLDDDVDSGTPLAATRVRELDATRLIAFLKAIELSTLTKRVAEAYRRRSQRGRGGPGAALRQAPRRHLRRPPGAARRRTPSAATGDSACRGRRSSPLAAADPPAMPAGRGAHAAANGHAASSRRRRGRRAGRHRRALRPRRIRDRHRLDRLDAWIAEAAAAGRVAIDTRDHRHRPDAGRALRHQPGAGPGPRLPTCRSPTTGEADLLGGGLLPGRSRQARRSPG